MLLVGKMEFYTDVMHLRLTDTSCYTMRRGYCLAFFRYLIGMHLCYFSGKDVVWQFANSCIG